MQRRQRRRRSKVLSSVADWLTGTIAPARAATPGPVSAPIGQRRRRRWQQDGRDAADTSTTRRCHTWGTYSTRGVFSRRLKNTRDGRPQTLCGRQIWRAHTTDTDRRRASTSVEAHLLSAVVADNNAAHEASTLRDRANSAERASDFSDCRSSTNAGASDKFHR